MIDPELKDPHLEIKEKVDFWHSRMSGQLSRFNSMADMWRLIRPARSANMDGFANPQVTETMRATEAIATFMYRGMTSANPNFQLLSSNPTVSQEDLWTSEQVIAWQQTATNYRRKLLKGCRSVALFGTVIVEEPWVVNMPYYEATDFLPRSMLQVAFDPLSFDISLSPWKAFIDFVTEDQLRYMGQKMPDIYDMNEIENAISSSKDMKNLSPEVMGRLSNAGYNNFNGSGSNTSRIYQLVTYYGCLSGNTGVEWTIQTINDLSTIRGHKMPYKRHPILVSHLNEFELEPIGYGVGRVSEVMQPEINSNRGRMHDTITFSLFNMWLANRMANIKTGQLKVKPWGVIEVDGNVEESLKALRPQLEGVNFGIQLEGMLKTEFRATTGASDNLQAIVTEATATESSIAQTEAVRRLSVITEIVSESLLREHVSKMHENNITFLDQPFTVGVAGRPNGLRVFPSDIALDVDVATKIVTDKDFRPQRNKDLLQFLQVVTSIRNQNPQMGQINLEPFVEEFARGVGMDPKRVWQAIPQLPGATAPAPMPQGAPPPNAMDKISQMLGSVRSNAGELGAAAHAAATAGAAA